MLTPAQLARMASAVEVLLRTCIDRRQALKPKEAEFLRADVEKLLKHLKDAAEKRDPRS